MQDNNFIKTFGLCGVLDPHTSNDILSNDLNTYIKSSDVGYYIISPYSAYHVSRLGYNYPNLNKEYIKANSVLEKYKQPSKIKVELTKLLKKFSDKYNVSLTNNISNEINTNADKYYSGIFIVLGNLNTEGPLIHIFIRIPDMSVFIRGYNTNGRFTNWNIVRTDITDIIDTINNDLEPSLVTYSELLHIIKENIVSIDDDGSNGTIKNILNDVYISKTPQDTNLDRFINKDNINVRELDTRNINERLSNKLHYNTNITINDNNFISFIKKPTLESERDEFNRRISDMGGDKSHIINMIKDDKFILIDGIDSELKLDSENQYARVYTDNTHIALVPNEVVRHVKPVTPNNGGYSATFNILAKNNIFYVSIFNTDIDNNNQNKIVANTNVTISGFNWDSFDEEKLINERLFIYSEGDYTLNKDYSVYIDSIDDNKLGYISDPTILSKNDYKAKGINKVELALSKGYIKLNFTKNSSNGTIRLYIAESTPTSMIGYIREILQSCKIEIMEYR